MIIINAQVTPDVNYIVQTASVMYKLTFRPEEPLEGDVCLWRIKWKGGEHE